MTFSINQLSVSRDQKQVLDQITLNFEQPQLVGLIGPNGAGKSTLMQALTGLLPFSGHIELEDRALADYHATERAQKLAFLPQDRTVHWALSCQAIVMLGRMPYRSSFSQPSAQDKAIVRDAMLQMDVLTFAERPFDRLSGGEQARVLIARLLAQEPNIILADEPVNGLDPAHQIALMHAFRGQVRLGRTVLVTLHELALASHWCDRIIMLDQGRVVADGSTHQVMTVDNIRQVYGVESTIVSASGRQLLVPIDL